MPLPHRLSPWWAAAQCPPPPDTCAGLGQLQGPVPTACQLGPILGSWGHCSIRGHLTDLWPPGSVQGRTRLVWGCPQQSAVGGSPLAARPPWSHGGSLAAPSHLLLPLTTAQHPWLKGRVGCPRPCTDVCQCPGRTPVWATAPSWPLGEELVRYGAAEGVRLGALRLDPARVRGSLPPTLCPLACAVHAPSPP